MTLGQGSQEGSLRRRLARDSQDASSVFDKKFLFSFQIADSVSHSCGFFEFNKCQSSSQSGLCLCLQPSVTIFSPCVNGGLGSSPTSFSFPFLHFSPHLHSLDCLPRCFGLYALPNLRAPHARPDNVPNSTQTFSAQLKERHLLRISLTCLFFSITRHCQSRTLSFLVGI